MGGNKATVRAIGGGATITSPEQLVDGGAVADPGGDPVSVEPSAQPTPAPYGDDTPTSPQDCTTTIPPTSVIDGRKTQFQPGAVVCLPAGSWGELTIQNVAGTPEQRIIFRNAGGQVKLRMLTVYNSQHLGILGNGDPQTKYGLLIEGSGITANFRRKTEYLEFAYAEIASSDAIALNATTQATCANGTGGSTAWDYTSDGRIDRQDAIGSEYVVHDLHFHHLFIRQAGSEAMYIGSNDTFRQARTLDCEMQQPVIDGVHIHDNRVQDFGRDGINVKGARNGVVVRNTIIGGSTLNDPGQNGAIKISQNASVDVLENTIEGNRGPGIGYIGTGGNTIARNVIKNVGGMFGRDDEKGSGIWVKPTGDGGPMIITGNTVAGSAAWGIHVTGAAHLARNRVEGSGNDALNVEQDEPLVTIPPGEVPTVEPVPPPGRGVATPPPPTPSDPIVELPPFEPPIIEEPAPTPSPTVAPDPPSTDDPPVVADPPGLPAPPRQPSPGPWTVAFCVRINGEPRTTCQEYTLALTEDGYLTVVTEQEQRMAR